MNAHLLGDAAAQVRARGVRLDGPDAVALAELLEEIEWQGSKDDEYPMREIVESARQLAERIAPARAVGG